VEYIDGVKSDEVAFITKVMSGSEYDKAAEGLNVVSRIRVSK
jgi:homoserine dehydrogenase